MEIFCPENFTEFSVIAIAIGEFISKLIAFAINNIIYRDI